MALTMRPTGLGSGIDKDRADYSVFCGEWNIGRIYEVRGGPDHLRWFWSFTLHGPMTRPFGNDALQTELAGVGTLRLPAGLWNPPRANPLIGDNQRRGRLCRVSSFTS
jgi:hypothetical protein